MSVVICLSSHACAAYDQETGRARGFAHVEFAEASAAAAAAAKNGELELDGRALRLDLSAGRSGGGGTPGANRGGQQTDGTTIFVKGFDFSGKKKRIMLAGLCARAGATAALI
jgi:RNA recognition motif-containing protein